MDKLFLEDSRRKRVVDIFTGVTAYGAILAVRGYVSGIIDDFRLRAIRKV